MDMVSFALYLCLTPDSEPRTGMTGTNFLNTPDGRLGWADYFLSKGYEVRSRAITQCESQCLPVYPAVRRRSTI